MRYAYNPAGQIVLKTVSNNAYVHSPTASATAYVNNDLNWVTAVGGAAVSYDVKPSEGRTRSGGLPKPVVVVADEKHADVLEFGAQRDWGGPFVWPLRAFACCAALKWF